jgi:protein-disulfide isomerase
VYDVISRMTRMAVVAGALSLAVFSPALAQRQDGPAEIPVADLMKPPGGLPEISLGPADAKVTIVEYASLSCGHCAQFHKNVLPELKTKYIDSGKIRLILRDHPGNDRAVAGAMLVRCLPADRAYPLMDALFKTQEQWAFAKESPLPKLLEISKQAGFSEESFNKCLTDDKLLKTINGNFEHALRDYGIRATPTFFVNGKRMQGAPNMDSFDKAIAEAEGKPNG